MTLMSELMAAIDDRVPVAVATVISTHRSVPRRAGSKMLVYADGTISGSIGGGEMESRVIAECLDALAVGRPRRLTYSLLDPSTGDPGVCGGEVELYLEPQMPTTTIYVIGTGHVGQAVVELASWLGYRVVAWDDRTELTEAVREADVVLSGSIEQALEEEPVDEHARIVMVTRNVALDTELLPALLATPAPYVGLMGSTRRWATTRKLLEDQGMAAADLDRVHSPVGLEISAETPAEIAVSVLAEVIGHERGE
ncbi:MAG: XdhC family protein [Acidimicrobiales bacterium]